jgi:hypothetical protein
MSDTWETFCDESYYHMWRLRRIGERGFNDGFHVNRREEAIGLCDLLNKMERELAEARKQRDTLAEALQKISNCDWVITLPDRMDAVRDIAREALASVKGGKP